MKPLKNPIRIPKDMEKVWEAYIRGSPLLGVPENPSFDPCYQVTIKPKPIIGTAHATKCRCKFTLEGCSGSACGWLAGRNHRRNTGGLYFVMAAKMEVEHKITAGSFSLRFFKMLIWKLFAVQYTSLTSVGIKNPKPKAIE